ncbi:chaperonin 10-like protein [Limtongia smithiae]|uniref:chaperonin 10-like protein n=1 Tax=Limtongia smithiae TaxID=1125753 RepID=UPI0034CE50FF
MTVNENPAFVLAKVGEFKYEDRDIPAVTGPTDVIIQIKSTGICGSDVHFYTHGKIGDFVVRAPLILGHESAGIVTAVGSEVTNVAVGDNVCVEPGKPCFVCSFCLGGQYNHCAAMRFAAAPPVDGTLTKYFKALESFVYKLPLHVSLDEGALMEPLSVACHVVKQADIIPGSSLVVFGAGPVGLLIAAVAKNGYGASKIVVVDVNAERLAFAKETYGFETYLSKRGKTHAEAAAEIIAVFGDDVAKNRGFDYGVDATGVEVCIHTALLALRPRATFVQAGMGGDIAALPISTICFRELNVKGCFRYNFGDFQRAVDFVSRGVVNVKALISGKVPFEKAAEAFENVRRGEGIKTIIAGPE